MLLIIHLAMKLSATLASVGVRNTGRSLFMDGLGVTLGTGTTVACFHSTGTTPSRSDAFMTSVR